MFLQNPKDDRMIKNRFKDDYSQYARLNGKGRVVDDICYTGDYYALPFDSERKKRTNLVNMGAALAFLVIQTAAGMVNQDSSRTFWIVYPYLFVFLPVAYFLIGAVSYWGCPLRMQKAQYETGLARIRRSCAGAMVMAGICMALDLVYIFIHHGDVRMGREIVYLLCHGLLLAVGFLYGRYYDRIYCGLTIEPSANKAE